MECHALNELIVELVKIIYNWLNKNLLKYDNTIITHSQKYKNLTCDVINMLND